VSPDKLFRQAEEFAYYADFVFEEVSERFDEFEAKLFGQCAYVMMELYIRSGVAVFRA